MTSLSFSAMLLIGVLNSKIQNQDCWDVGTFVEVAEETVDEAKKKRQWRAWVFLAPTRRKKILVWRAKAAHEAGITSSEIYKECQTI
jgi:hypothetical protein|tara:strand:- start:316 stop:576 length:261 start_codon:yes stop_codon:yes gene_type:complete